MYGSGSGGAGGWSVCEDATEAALREDVENADDAENADAKETEVAEDRLE